MTEDGVVAADGGVDSAESEVFWFMVALQTCDIVRRCVDRPFVEGTQVEWPSICCT